jgi:hypothetical protein
VTAAGTHTTELLELDRDTLTPPVPAGAVKVTIPIPDWPALVMVPGLTEMPLKAGAAGLTVTPNVAFTPE